MAHATPTRRALVDLPVNTFGTPSEMNKPRKEAPSHMKRPFREVEEPEYTQPTTRVKVSPTRSQVTPSDLPEARPSLQTTSRRTDNILQVLPNRLLRVDISTTIPTSAAHIAERAERTEPTEDGGDAESQHSYKGSMSSLIDFDPDETMVSQQTAATDLTQPIVSRASQRAENLRLRLRLAHFKVKTNQIQIPLSQLRISTERELSSQSQESAATPDEEPSLPKLKLLPAPILRPTAYSTRTISKPQILSSPPSSAENSPGKSAGDDVFRTPALPRHPARNTLRQTSSPPDSAERILRKRYDEDDDLTSSAIRGNAAIGLLGLRQER